MSSRTQRGNERPGTLCTARHVHCRPMRRLFGLDAEAHGPGGESESVAAGAGRRSRAESPVAAQISESSWKPISAGVQRPTPSEPNCESSRLTGSSHSRRGCHARHRGYGASLGPGPPGQWSGPGLILCRQQAHHVMAERRSLGTAHDAGARMQCARGPGEHRRGAEIGGLRGRRLEW